MNSVELPEEAAGRRQHFHAASCVEMLAQAFASFGIEVVDAKVS